MHSHVDSDCQHINPSPQVIIPICGVLAQIWGHFCSCVIMFCKRFFFFCFIRKLRVNDICDVLMRICGCGSKPYQTRQWCVNCNMNFSRLDISIISHSDDK